MEYGLWMDVFWIEYVLWVNDCVLWMDECSLDGWVFFRYRAYFGWMSVLWLDECVLWIVEFFLGWMCSLDGWECSLDKWVFFAY